MLKACPYIVSAVLSFIIYFTVAFKFTRIDLMEMLVVYHCFVLPFSQALPILIRELKRR